MDVIDDYNKKIKKEKSIELTLYGLEYAGPDKVYDGNIHIIALGYALDKRIQYQEARTLFYEIIDGLLEKLNNAKHLDKCFFNKPLTYKDLDILLSFDYDRKGFLKKGDASLIYVFENKVSCHIIEIEGPEEIKQREVIPNVFILDQYAAKDRVIKEDPYTKAIIGTRECLATPKPEQKP